MPSTIHGGRFYGRLTAGGPLVPVTDVGDAVPDVWICRRVADFPRQQVPTGAGVAPCTRCAAPLVFNPEREVTAPRVCMQCTGIVPLPLDQGPMS